MGVQWCTQPLKTIHRWTMWITTKATLLFLILRFSNGKWTEWSTIQGVIRRVILNRPSAWREDDFKLQARLPLNCTTRSPVTN